jgi:hypothetical protein
MPAYEAPRKMILRVSDMIAVDGSFLRLHCMLYRGS